MGKTKSEIARLKKAKAAKRTSRGLPSREDILAFVADNPGLTGKKEIGRAFKVQGSAKIDLKAMLKEMANEGLLKKRGKRMIRPGDLPPVGVIDIVARDRDGGLLARPADHNDKSGPAPTIYVQAPRGKVGVVAGVGSRVLARISRNKEEGADYYAKVMKVIDKQKDVVLGILSLEGDEPRILAITKRQDEMVVSLDALNGAQNGDLVEVEPVKSFKRNDQKYGLKHAKITRIVGSMGSEKAVSMIAIHANEIPHIFPDDVISEAENAKAIDHKKMPHEDWRHIPLITIDPADAKDHDDAIFAEADPDIEGGFICTVAIADVSWYVRPASSMDVEALHRGNSVYFPDRVVPMLPERISNDLCSLRENEDRPSLAVKMWFDASGKKSKHSFHRALMRNHANLAYPDAQAAIDGSPNEKAKEFLEPVLKPLWAAFACLTKGRENRAPLELDLPERKIKLKDDGTVDRVIVPDRLDAHKLVEEFMIQANVCAAESLEARKQNLIYRIHDAPSQEKLARITDFLKSLNLSIIKTGNLRAENFNGILKSVAGTENEELVNQVVLRTQSAAEYSPDNIGHFGLNLRKYAHFTSPIRRYADLIVHRALVGSLALGEGGITPQEEGMLDVIAADISITERRAMNAERETIDRLIAGFLCEQIGESFNGRINGVTKSGLFVTLADSGADGFIPISKISDDYYHFDPATHTLTGERTRTSYQMGMDVEVRLVEAAPVAGALRFEMISEGKPVKGLERSARTNQRGNSGGSSFRTFGSGKRRKGSHRR